MVRCGFPGCQGDIWAKGLCRGHYTQQYRGRPLTSLNGKRGFAAISPERQRELAVRGGKAAHERGTAHQWTRAEAKRAGQRGGAVSAARRKAAALQRQGLTT